jgi:two-component system, NarL family, response regulator DesR
MGIRILVADDAGVYRETLVAVLELEEDFEVVAEVASGDRIVPTALEHRPDVALLDIDLPGTDGLSAAARLRKRVPACRVLIVTGLAGSENLHRAVAAGVSGFVVKDSSADSLVDAVRRVAGGQRVFPIRPV